MPDQVKKLAAIVFWCLISGSAKAADIPAKELIFFEQKIRPVLEENCLRCHSQAKKQKGGLLLDRKAGWMKGGDSEEPVIIPGNPDESLLVLMIQQHPDVEAMPPKKKLSDTEIANVIEWIRRGAHDPRTEAVDESPVEEGFDLEERKNFWSLRPLKNAKVPEVKLKGWPRNDYDRFIMKGLEEKGWQPAVVAEKATLLRRASITLTGLAPSVEEVTAFLDDDSPDAYEKQIDRLLASPHFGERFARHWMDVVRFADSKSYENDYTIPYANEYRDYLIRAFNDDVPFDQFTKEAFAGDLLESPRINQELGINESVIGPGFMLFTDGQHGPPDIHEDEARVFDGMINTASVAFQSLTVSCARCHDHKFDAITTADYYSMYGVLRSSRLDYANCSVLNETHRDLLTKLENAKLRFVETSLADSVAQNAKLTQVIRTAISLGKNPQLKNILSAYREHQMPEHLMSLKQLVRSEVKERTQAELVHNWLSFLWTEESILELNELRRRLVKTGPVTNVGKYQMDPRFKWRGSGEGVEEVSSSKMVVDPVMPSGFRGGLGKGLAIGRLAPRLSGSLRTEDFILDGKPVSFWVKGQNIAVNFIIRNYELVGRGPTTAVLKKEINSDNLTKITFPTVLWEGETGYFEVVQHGTNKKCLAAKQSMEPPRDTGYAFVPKAFDASSWSQFWDVSTPEEAVSKIELLLKNPQGNAEVLGALLARGLLVPSQDKAKRLAEIKSLQGQIPKPRYVRTLTEGHQYEQGVFIRGSHKNVSKKENQRRFLDAFGGVRIGEVGSGRLEFANHLLTTSAHLTARVRVNRIWARIFGQGLVASVDDFGMMGRLPSHPDLLDFMAAKFIEDGWSTKRLIRDLMISSTFRMSSRPAPKSISEDPANILLQHMPLQRMDAESVRDHILHASGRLDRRIFGKSIPIDISDQPRSRGAPRNGPIDGNGRRSIYLEIRRNFLSTFLRAFDFPNPGAPVGVREVTTVPAQSLALMNDDFVHGQAEVWAKRIRKAPGGIDAKLRQLHLEAFSRPAKEGDLVWGRRVLKELGNGVSGWTSLCHLMINRKEFIYVF